jgi:hypothetical protein
MIIQIIRLSSSALLPSEATGREVVVVLSAPGVPSPWMSRLAVVVNVIPRLAGAAATAISCSSSSSVVVGSGSSSSSSGGGGGGATVVWGGSVVWGSVVVGAVVVVVGRVVEVVVVSSGSVVEVDVDVEPGPPGPPGGPTCTGAPGTAPATMGRARRITAAATMTMQARWSRPVPAGDSTRSNIGSYSSAAVERA